jgi:hypothetical protein
MRRAIIAGIRKHSISLTTKTTAVKYSAEEEEEL